MNDPLGEVSGETVRLQTFNGFSPVNWLIGLVKCKVNSTNVETLEVVAVLVSSCMV